MSFAPVNYKISNGIEQISMADKNAKPKPLPACKPLKGKYTVFQGHQIPLKREEVPMELPTDSMFYLANNRSSLECAMNPYTTDRGYVCLTPLQRHRLQGCNKCS